MTGDRRGFWDGMKAAKKEVEAAGERSVDLFPAQCNRLEIPMIKEK